MRICLNRIVFALGLTLLWSGLAPAQEPIAVIQQNSSRGQAVSNNHVGPISLADMRAMLAELDLAPYQLQAVDNMVMADIDHDGLKVPVIFTLSNDGSRIWIKTVATKVENGKLPPWQTMIELQESIKPAMFSYRGNTGELIVRYPLANVGITRDKLKADIIHFLDCLVSVRSAWDSQKWTASGSNAPVYPAPNPYAANMPAAPQPEAVMKAVHDHLARVAVSAQEFIADSDAFESGKPLSSETIARDLTTARQRINSLLGELDNLPAPTDAEGREYVDSYKKFARTFLVAIDLSLVECGQTMASYLDSPQPGQTREMVKDAMRVTMGKASKIIMPAKEQFMTAEGSFKRHYNLVASN